MSKTTRNLEAAFAGESMARNKYTYYAKVAAKEGYHYIAKLFEETAENEKRHAKDHFIRLGGLGSTPENLKAAAAGEHFETEEMYPTFAREAEEEGNTEAANLFRQIAKVEKEHEERYLKLLKMVEEGTVFKREQPIEWKCGVCGFHHNGTTPPPKCPCCGHPMEYFEPTDLSFAD